MKIKGVESFKGSGSPIFKVILRVIFMLDSLEGQKITELCEGVFHGPRLGLQVICTCIHWLEVSASNLKRC